MYSLRHLGQLRSSEVDSSGGRDDGSDEEAGWGRRREHMRPKIAPRAKLDIETMQDSVNSRLLRLSKKFCRGIGRSRNFFVNHFIEDETE